MRVHLTTSIACLLFVGAARAADAPAPSPPPAAAAPAALSVRLVKPDGGQTSERVVTLEGRVTGNAGPRVTLVVNGLAMSVPIKDGAFSQPQVLSPGTNTIRAVLEEQGRVAEDALVLHASVPAKDLRVTLTWDTPDTDVDLWVTGPDGEKVFYGDRDGKAGGVLDTDVTTGHGPETYTQARLSRGTYRVQAHAYGISRPTRVEVTAVRREGTPDEERRTFRAVLLRTGEVVEAGEFVE
jgi:uncharacterized protein YfaP (DUF2135 family)